MFFVSQRFQQRLERFGKIAPEAKKISRALRFGTTHVNDEYCRQINEHYSFLLQEAVDDVAKKRRLDRFGVATDSAVSNNSND